jgi:hypothetical protein
MTDREAILQALFARLQTVTDATVLRNEALPERIPDGGLIILRDGDPGEPETLLSPLSYYWQHRALVEAVVQKGDQAARDLALDGLYRKISLLPSRATARWAGCATALRRKHPTATCWRSRDRRRSKAQSFPSNSSTSPPIPSADFLNLNKGGNHGSCIRCQYPAIG